jgi:hypothetical protein
MKIHIPLRGCSLPQVLKTYFWNRLSYTKKQSIGNILKKILTFFLSKNGTYGKSNFLLRILPGEFKGFLLWLDFKIFQNAGYSEWMKKNEPGNDELELQTKTRFKYRPLISVVTPTWNTPPSYLEELFNSLLRQTYPHWEWCIADGNSDPIVREKIKSLCMRDPRIKVKFLLENKGISGNSNEALALARGGYVALVDHDDLLPSFALFEVVKCLNDDKTLDFIYSDEDKILEAERYDPVFKPDYSPDMLLSHNYICHLSVCRRTIIQRLKFREGFNGAQDYDLILRITEMTRRIFHIPKILYHWRISPNSTSESLEHKPYAESGTQGARVRA